MSYFELGICDLDEFEDNKEVRIQEDSLNLASLYTAIFKLKRVDGKALTGNPFEAEAFKLQARITSKEKKTKLGVYVVGFEVLNYQQGVEGTANMNLFDGYLTDPTGKELLVGGPDPENPFKGMIDYTASVGFFKEYEGDGVSAGEESDHAEAEEEKELIALFERELALV